MLEKGNCCYIRGNKKLWLIVEVNKDLIVIKDIEKGKTGYVERENIIQIIESLKV